MLNLKFKIPTSPRLRGTHKNEKLKPEIGNSFPTSCKLPATIYSGGFTLIETLVAIFIFSFSILGIITISSRGVSDLQYAKNRMVASYLAQEGIELTRNIRDTTVINTGGWAIFTGMISPVCQPTDGGCGINYSSYLSDPSTSPLFPCATFPECAVYYDGNPFSGKGYIQDRSGQGAYTATNFSRVITAELIPMSNGSAGDQIRVVSKVSWTQGSSNTVYSVSAEENLFNWIL